MPRKSEWQREYKVLIPKVKIKKDTWRDSKTTGNSQTDHLNGVSG